MEHLSRIFGYATKPITLTLTRTEMDTKSKQNKREKLFVNFHTSIKFRKDKMIISDKKINEIQTDTCSNIEINKDTLTFIILIDRHGKPTTTEYTGFDEYLIKFSDIKEEEIIKIFRPQFEGKVDLSQFNYTTNIFETIEKSLDLKLFTFKDIRATKTIPEKLKLPEFFSSNYILNKSIDKYDGGMQFFLDKQNKYFIFILKDNITKRLEFPNSLDFISFSTTYINSLGEGFFSPLDEDDFKYEETEEEEHSTKSEDNDDMTKSFVANLKLSDSPNKLLTSQNSNLLISDGKNLGIFNSQFDREGSLEINAAELGTDITKLQFNNSELFFIDNEILKSYDLEKQSTLNSESKGVKDIFENTNNSSDCLRGITKDKIFQVDTRNKDMIIPLRTYRTSVNFECANLNGEITAIGSENGDIRIFKGFEKRALVHLHGYGERCIGLSVWGNFIAATFKNYIILIFGKPAKPTEKDRPEIGFPLVRKALIGTKKLSLSLEHTLRFKMANKQFKPAMFVNGNKVVSSVENYLISWELNLKDGVDLNSKIEDVKYNLGKFSDQIVCDKIVKDQVFVLFKDKIQVDNVGILERSFD
ncbi:Vacuolar import and degradation protein 27 [Cucumispora dikerogammari]|nr:Vacuolar import and degradation protein 27 [Cucumispora dikerogammari]